MNVRSNRLGLALLLVGGLLLVTRLTPGNLLVELIWLAGFALLASYMWRALEGRAPLGWRIGVHGVIGIVATATLTTISGPVFLGFASLAFFLTYWYSPRGRQREGWALIPAGVMATLALVAGVDTLLPRWDGGSIFLLGMTATFTYIYLLPRERGGGRWALWPALVWAGITLLANDPGGGLARWLVPLAMIGGGVALIGWARGRRK
ncbi:MAG: hypothetical protein WDA03_12100 [Trueperaceae bacterium]